MVVFPCRVSNCCYDSRVEKTNREAYLLTNTLQHTRSSCVGPWQGRRSWVTNAERWYLLFSILHAAGPTDVSPAKIISTPDLSQAGQECVTGTAWINILTHGSHFSTHTGTQVHTALVAHHQRRGGEKQKEKINKNVRISPHAESHADRFQRAAAPT